MHARYEALMDVVRGRMTNRAFAPAEIPREHVEMILESARHAPSGANAQPWHYIVVTDPAVKRAIGQSFVDEQQRRARLRMGFPTPNYHGVKTAPGLVIVVADFRFVRAFPVLNDGSEWTVYKRYFSGPGLVAELGGGEVLLDGAWFVAVRSPL